MDTRRRNALFPMSGQQTLIDYSKTGGITVKRHTIALLTLGLAVLALSAGDGAPFLFGGV